MSEFHGFEQPSITLLSGSTGSGKTSLVREFLQKNLIKKIHNIVILCEYPEENPYQQITTMAIMQNPQAKLIKSEMKNLDSIIGDLDKSKINFVFIDDKLNSNDFHLGKIAAVDSRHKNCTTFCVTQNIHNDQKNFRHFRKQVRYFVIFTESGDRSIIIFLKNAFPEFNFHFRSLPKTKWLLCDKVENKFYKDDYKEVFL